MDEALWDRGRWQVHPLQHLLDTEHCPSPCGVQMRTCGPWWHLGGFAAPLWRHWDGDTFKSRDRNHVRSEFNLQGLRQSICECAEEERQLSCRYCSLEMPAPAQPPIHSPSKESPQSHGHHSCLCSPLLMLTVLMWTKPAQEKSMSLGLSNKGTPHAFAGTRVVS